MIHTHPLLQEERVRTNAYAFGESIADCIRCIEDIPKNQFVLTDLLGGLFIAESFLGNSFDTAYNDGAYSLIPYMLLRINNAAVQFNSNINTLTPKNRDQEKCFLLIQNQLNRWMSIIANEYYQTLFGAEKKLD